MEKNWFIDLCNKIKDLINTNNLPNTELIIKVINDIIINTKNSNLGIQTENKFYYNYSSEEYLVLNILEDMFKTKKDLSKLDPYDINDKIYIENHLNQILIEINKKDVYEQTINVNLPQVTMLNEVALFNLGEHNYKKMIKLNEKTINSFNTMQQQNQHISFHQHNLHQQLVNNKDRKFIAHYNTMGILESQGFKIWKDLNTKLWYSIKSYEVKQKVSSTEISDIIKNDFNLHVEIYNNTDEVIIIDSNYLIIALLPTVRKDSFIPFSNSEFPLISKSLRDRNTFEYTEFLHKRFWQSVNSFKGISFIEILIESIFTKNDYSNFFINWNASFFKTLAKSNAVIVLIGDKETTNFLVNSIIRPIFAKKKKYISVIDDNVLTKESDDEKILKDKIFYHIDNISSKSDKRRIKKLVRDILKPNLITLDEALNNDEIFISGNLLITSSKDSPYEYLKDIYSNCAVFRVKNMEDVLNALNINPATIEEMVISDLDNFTNRLFNHHVDYFNGVIDTEEKQCLHTMKNGVLITPAINSKIDKYIQYVRDKNMDVFIEIKLHDEKIYEELLSNFNEDMIAQPMQSIYFNMINKEDIISSNSEFLNILQSKADMFNESPTDKSKMNGKKRYKIF